MSQQHSEAEQLQILADAGISAEDVDLVVQDRLRRRREKASEDAEALRTAHTALDYADVGTPVPEPERWRKGAQITDTDRLGAWRTLSAAIVQADSIAGAVVTSAEAAQKRGEVLHGMCRREAEGKHKDNVWLIENARPRRGGGHIGNGG